jgi:hypothetical protein
MRLVWPVLVIGDGWVDIPVVLAWIATGVVASILLGLLYQWIVSK